MARHERQHDCRVVVGGELRPVERHDDLRLAAYEERNPVLEELPGLDGGVAQQAIYLLHSVLRLQPPGLRQRLPDQVNRECGSVYRAEHCVRERHHSLGVHVLSDDGFEELLDRRGAYRVLVHGPKMIGKRPQEQRKIREGA